MCLDLERIERWNTNTTTPHDGGCNWVKPGLVQHPNDEGPKQYHSVMEEQLSSLEARIDYMNNALNTLEQRLAPVMRDNPSKATEASLPCADSPIGRKLENFNSRMNALQNQILHIIERLEI